MTVVVAKDKKKEAEPAKPTRTKEMDEFLNEIAEVKTLNANLQAKTSTRAKEMFDKMKETRRAKHIEVLKEYESWIETFNESMKERYEERKKQSETLRATTSSEIEKTLSSMDDATLLSSEIEYVTYAWDHISEMRKERKEEVGTLGTALRELHKVKANSVLEYVTNLRGKLVDIAFLLEPQIVTIIEEIVTKQQAELDKELKEIDEYLSAVTAKEQTVFEGYYARWKERKERFHLLKQNEALQNFKNRMQEKYFVNPEERVARMKRLMEYQLKMYKARKQLLTDLQAINVADVTKDKVNDIDEKLKKLNEEASEEYKKAFQDCLDIQQQRHKEALGLVEYLKGFLVKNDAKLPEGRTFDMIIAEECTPIVEQRLKESKDLLLHIDKYLEEFDSRMHEYSKNIIGFYRYIGESYDQQRKDMQNVELQFELAVAKLADQNEDNMHKRDELLQSQVDSVRKSVTHVVLVERLQQCYATLDVMNKEYDKYEAELRTLVATQEPKVVTTYQGFELKLAQHFKLAEAGRRDKIQERLNHETEEKQKQMEDEYVKKKELEEQKSAVAAPPGSKPGSPPKPKPVPVDKSKAKGKGGKVDLAAEVPRLEPPKVQEFKSPAGELYVVDYPVEKLAADLMQSEEEIERQKLEEARLAEERKKQEELAAEEAKLPKGKKGKAEPAKKPAGKQKEDPAKLEEEERARKAKEEAEAKRKAEEEAKERLRSCVPRDPEGNQCLNERLLLVKQEVVDILTGCMNKVLDQIAASRQKYIDALRKKNVEMVSDARKILTL